LNLEFSVGTKLYRHSLQKTIAMDWTIYIMTVVIGYPAAIIAAFWVARSLFKEGEGSD